MCSKNDCLIGCLFFSVKQALIEQNRRLPGGRPEKKYTELLQNKYMHIVGTPKWAKLDREKEADSGDESDDEILKVSSILMLCKYILTMPVTLDSSNSTAII